MRNFTFLILLTFLALLSYGQKQFHVDANRIIEERGELYFSFDFAKNYSIDRLSSMLSLDKMESNHRAFAYANKREFAKFLSLGVDYRIEKEAYLITAPVMAQSVAALMQNWDAYPTYYQYDSVMLKLANDYPDLCRYHILDTLPSGRKIIALQLGDSAAIHQHEPRFLYTSSMHGNELVGYVLMLRLADYLLSNYGQNAQVDSLMNNIEIWINPLANPDGAYQAGDTLLSGATRYNANFVDLNRNYPNPKYGVHPDGNAWQPETKIFMDFADSLHFSMSANFHGGNEVLNYPWDTWSKLPADHKWWRNVCFQYADTVHTLSPSNYFLGPLAANGSGVVNGYQWYSVFGSRQDYMNYFQACREVTIELSNNKIPTAASLNNYWSYNYRSMLNYINQVRFGLAGIITDSISGKPLSAEVFIASHDQDSSQVFSHLPMGDYYRLLDSGYYRMRFSAPHYYSKTIDSVHIIRNKLVDLNVALAPDYTATASQLEPFLVQLSPNPVRNFLNIHAEHGIRKIEIYSIDGRLLKSFDVDQNLDFSINMVGIESGIVLIRMEDVSRISVFKKIIIQ